MVRGYSEEGGKDEGGSVWGLCQQGPLPSTKLPTPPFPSPTRLLKRKDPGLRIQTTTGPERRVSGAGWERDSRKERGREWQGVLGQTVGWLPRPL